MDVLDSFSGPSCVVSLIARFCCLIDFIVLIRSGQTGTNSTEHDYIYKALNILLDNLCMESIKW